MTIAIDYDSPVTLPPPDTGGSGSEYNDDDYGDVCSILVPVDITGTGALRQVTAGGADLSEDSRLVWQVGVTYSPGIQVYVPATHRVYESFKEGNVGKDPTDPANRYNAAGVATWWIEIGPTNKYAMFDGLVSTQTVAASPLVITLTPGSFNGFALFGVDADSYSVVIKDSPGGTIVYQQGTTPLEASQPADYYEYFFDRFKPLRQFIRAGLEPYGGAEITLTLNKGSGNVGLGMFAIGDLRPVGIPQRQAAVQPQDFSYVKQDAFGNTTVIKRTSATGMTLPVIVEEEDVNSVLDTVKEILGVPAVIIGSQAPRYEWLTVFGLISGDMSAGPYPYSTLKLNVKGLI